MIPIFLSFVIITLAVKLTLIALNIKSVQENIKVPADFSSVITEAEHQKAQKYTLDKSRFSLIKLFFDYALVMGWLFSGALVELNSVILTFKYSELITGVIFLISFSTINGLISLPFSLYYNFVIEEKYGFNKMTPSLFLKDYIKQFALSLMIGVPLIYAILSFLYFSGDFWWLIAWAFIMIFQFIMIWAYPKFIAPLFNKFTPLDDSELTEDIEKLVERCGLHFKDFFKMNASIRSSHGNAYFTGFGKNKRIVFFDTLLEKLEKSEIIAVLAHELGHLKKKHILKSIVMSAFGLLIGLFILAQAVDQKVLLKAFSIDGGTKYMQLLLFTLVIPYFTFILTPIGSWLSRKNEFEADQFAAKNADAQDLINALMKLIRDNSSSLTPHPLYSKFYFSHPPPKERVEFLKTLQTESP